METGDLIRAHASVQYGLVSRRQLRADCIGGDAIDHRVRKGELQPLSADVLRLVGSPESDQQRGMAAVLDAPGEAYLSHRSAAAWWGIPGFDLEDRLHVTIPHAGIRKRTRLSVIHYHRGLPDGHLLRLGGVPVTSPPLTIFQLAGTVHPKRTERALDNMAAMGLGSYRSIHDLLSILAARGRKGIALIRELLAERPPGASPPGSGTEKRLEHLASEIGISLRPQIDVGGDCWDGRSDFVFADSSAALIEVLSRRHHGMLLDRRADAARFEQFRNDGFQLLVLWEDDIWYRPQQVKTMLARFHAEVTGVWDRRAHQPWTPSSTFWRANSDP